MRRRGRASHDVAPERGFALLIVFVFAAIVALMLYRELPVAAFEARRQQEQLLVDRGHEYVRAIQLYYRRFRRYPQSIDALENTNRMRFLRHKYKDPFTGKDDWRLVHTNGLALTDSKVKPKTTAASNSNNPNSSSNQSQWFTRSNSGFSTETEPGAGQTSSSDQPEVIVQPVRTRRPAISVSESMAGNTDNAPAGDNAGDDLNAELQTSLQSQPGITGSGAQQSAAQQNGEQAAGSQQPNSANTPNPMQMVRNMLSSESPMQPQQMGSSMGTIQSGGIAGVASKAGGHTIKVIDDQTDYSLWEFVYDPTKDTTGRQGLAVGPGARPSTTTASPSSTNTGGFGMQPAEGTVGTNGSAPPAVRMNPQ